MTTIIHAYRMGLIGLRTHNALRAAGHQDVGRVIALSDGQLLAIRGIGPTSLTEIRRLADDGSRGSQDAGSVSEVFPTARTGLGAILMRARATMPELWWEILRERMGGVTLVELGKRRGVTREWIRQIESKAKLKLRRLIGLAGGLEDDWTRHAKCLLVSEAHLFAPHLDADASEAEQLALGHIAAWVYGFRRLKAFGGANIDGWWTFDQRRFLGVLTALADHCPIEPSDLEEWAESNRLPGQLPWTEILLDNASPLRYHHRARAWVRPRSVTRDAADAVLSRRGTAMSGEAVAEELGVVKSRNVEEQMRRDGRFRQLRPSGMWVLGDWNAESRYGSTLEAVIDVLRQEGPQTGAQLARAVASRYPVTHGAVQQCMTHESIGRWPDGRVDLVERGATHPAETQPKQPRDIVLDQDGGIILMYRVVDTDLMRGSGLTVPRFLGWILGLRVAPRSRVFEVPGHGEIEVRRLIQGTSVSSLRKFALELGADLMCRIAVRFDCQENVATVGLACEDHVHVSRAVLGSGKATAVELEEEPR